MKRSIYLVFFILLSSGLFGQMTDSKDIDQRIEVIGKYDGEKIILRWAPNKPSVWEVCNYFGYRLERLAYKSEGKVDTSANFQVMGDSILKPLPLELWEPLVKANPDDDYLKVEAQAIYGNRPAQENADAAWLKKAQEFQNLYAMAMISAEFSALAAESAALRFEDSDIKPNSVYVYRIMALAPDDHMQLDTAYAFIQTDTIAEIPPVEIDHFYEGEQFVEFTWLKGYYQHFYSGYFVERSEDGGKTFSPLNRVPMQQTAYNDTSIYYFKDSVDYNYKRYQYRIYGITPFAEHGPFSEIIIAQGRDRTPPSAPVNVKSHYRGEGLMEVTWEVNPEDKDIAGFLISKSNKANEGFMQLTPKPLPPDARMFIDSSCNELVNNYYFVGVLDTAGNGNVALPEYGTIIDSIPPAPPTGLSGSIDTNGVVTVTWEVGPELDLQGYFIHFANAEDHVYINQVGHPITDTIWRDTIPLNVLTESIYYKLVAVDHRFNYSSYSEVLELKKPDLVPPVPPLFKDSYVDKDVIQIQFYTSTSHDVVENQLWRLHKNSGEKKMILSRNSNDPVVVCSDTDVEEGNWYTYYLIALDDAGIASQSPGSLELRAFENKVLPEPEQITVHYNKEENRYTLSWNWIIDNTGARFVIYRAVNDYPWQTYKVVKYPLREFTDIGMQEGDTVRFRIKAADNRGKSSGMSEEAVLTF